MDRGTADFYVSMKCKYCQIRICGERSKRIGAVR